MRSLLKKSVFPACLAALIMSCQTSSIETLSDLAVQTNRPAGAPKYSDVSFSSRWPHPRDVNDPHDTFRDAAAFHATRLDWVYSFDPEWIRESKARGFHFGGALNTKLPDKPDGVERKKGRVLNQKAELVTAPWMATWEHWWGCVNNPAYRQIYLEHAKLIIDGGADVLHMDDPGLNYAAVEWGGCFCDFCREKAAAQGVDLQTGMKAFQKASVTDFYRWFRDEIDRYAGRRVPMSSNNYEGVWGFPYNLFDFGIAELPEPLGTPHQMYQKFSWFARHDIAQVFTFVSVDVALYRRVIATAYSCGGHVLAPYDVYHENHPRIFGKPEDYADLYGFARAMAGYLDGYEDAAVAGQGFADERFAELPSVEIAADSVYAFVRARPHDASAPVVIHMVDWRSRPEPTTIMLLPVRFFAENKVVAELFVPPAYESDDHVAAEKSGDFAELKFGQSLQPKEEGKLIQLDIPALHPWGMIIVKPQTD